MAAAKNEDLDKALESVKKYNLEKLDLAHETKCIHNEIEETKKQSAVYQQELIKLRSQLTGLVQSTDECQLANLIQLSDYYADIPALESSVSHLTKQLENINKDAKVAEEKRLDAHKQQLEEKEKEFHEQVAGKKQQLERELKALNEILLEEDVEQEMKIEQVQFEYEQDLANIRSNYEHDFAREQQVVHNHCKLKIDQIARQIQTLKNQMEQPRSNPA